MTTAMVFVGFLSFLHVYHSSTLSLPCQVLPNLCARLDNVTPLCYNGFQQGEEIMVLANHISYIVLDEQDENFFYLADSLAEVEEQVRWLRATDQEPIVYEVGSPVKI